MEIQQFNQADIALLPSIQPVDWPDIRIPIQFYINADFCFPFKVLIDKVLVGTGTSILHNNVGWLATIVTHPEYRNLGIGKQITEHLVAHLQSHHCEHIYLKATALGEPVYTKVGFVAETKYLYYKDIKANNFEISENIIPYQPAFKSQIFDLDVLISGENRSNHLEFFLKESQLYLENQEITGVYFPTFGEGLIVSKTEEAGLELMKARFQTFDKASFPLENTVAIDFMEMLGYQPITSFSRMYFGERMPWQPHNLYNRVGGKIG